MTDEVRAAVVPAGSSPAVRVAAIRRQNQAVWLQDWETIMSLRERAVVALSVGSEPSFTMPAIDGHPIVERMNRTSDCVVPVELTGLP